MIKDRVVEIGTQRTGKLVRDNESPLVRWDDNGETTRVSWSRVMMADGSPKLTDREEPPELE